MKRKGKADRNAKRPLADVNRFEIAVVMFVAEWLCTAGFARTRSGFSRGRPRGIDGNSTEERAHTTKERESRNAFVLWPLLGHFDRHHSMLRSTPRPHGRRQPHDDVRARRDHGPALGLLRQKVHLR